MKKMMWKFSGTTFFFPILFCLFVLIAARFPSYFSFSKKFLQDKTESQILQSQMPKLFLTPTEAAHSIGKIVKVKGKVISTYYADFLAEKPTFLNLDHLFPHNEIAIVILNEDLHLFPNIHNYEGKEIVLEGKVCEWKYENGIKPIIYLSHPEQIRVLEE